METHPRTPAAPLDVPRARHAFGTARNSVALYGVLSAATLLAVVVVALCDAPVNTFMWVRAVLLPLAAVLLHRLTAAASRGSQRAFERVRILATVLPVAIVGVDLVPGVCPPWYAVAQALCMLPVVRLAFLLHGSALRAAFPARR